MTHPSNDIILWSMKNIFVNWWTHWPKVIKTVIEFVHNKKHECQKYHSLKIHLKFIWIDMRGHLLFSFAGQLFLATFCLGAFKNYIDHFVPYFDYLPTSGWHFYQIALLSNVDIWRTTYLPRLVNVVFGWPLRLIAPLIFVWYILNFLCMCSTIGAHVEEVWGNSGKD